MDICQEQSQIDDCLVYCQAQSVDFIASVNFTGITVSYYNKLPKD